MASPSLKKMGEGGNQEGIYASSDASYVGEVNRTDLGLTLLPGSQIQTGCDKQGHPRQDNDHQEREFLRELENGSKKGNVPNSGEGTLCGRVQQDVCSQEKSQIFVEIQPEVHTGPERHETNCVPVPSCMVAADRVGERARTEPRKASLLSNSPARSCALDRKIADIVYQYGYPVNVPVSELPSFAVKGINEFGVRHGLTHSVEGDDVALVNDSGLSESDAEDGKDRVRSCKRQKTEEYLPSSLFDDLQDDLVEQLDSGVDLFKCGLSDEDVGAILTVGSRVLRSRSHNPANDVLSVTRGTGSEPEPPSRLTSTPALETRSRRLSTPGSLGISSGLSLLLARPERSYRPLSAPPQASRATSIPTLHIENRATSRQSHKQPNPRASSLPVANLGQATERADSFNTHSQPRCAVNEGLALPYRPPSTPALQSFDLQESERFPSASVTIGSLSELPPQQNRSGEALHAATLSTISVAQRPFTEHSFNSKNNSIHLTTRLNNTADGTANQGDGQLLETRLSYRIGPLPRQEAYQSPYAPKSQRLQTLLGSQTEERRTIPNTGYRDPMEHSTPEVAMTDATTTTPSSSQHPRTAALLPSTTSFSGPISQPMPAVQSASDLSTPSLPAPNDKSASTTGSPERASSEQNASESDDTSSDSSSEGSPAPTERILVPPALINAAKKGLHAITSVILNRIHHDDIIPRVISFIRTFPTSDEKPNPPIDPCSSDDTDLLYKNHSLSLRNQSLLERNAILQRERDRFKRAAGEWATKDAESGITKGQLLSREVRSLRKQLAKKVAEVEDLRTARNEYEASRANSHQWNYSSTMRAGGPPSRDNGNGHEPRVDVIWQDTPAVPRGYESYLFPTAEPTPPVSKRVSIDLTEGAPDPSSTLATPQSAPAQPLPSSPAAAALRSTMKRKAYSWLPDKSNHMVKRPKLGARGSHPSTAIELDVEAPAFDPDAELEAELERELLASQHAEEVAQRRRQAAWQRRQKMTPKEKVTKDRRAKAATRAARTGRVEEERQRLVLEEHPQHPQQPLSQRVEDEQRQREVEERPGDEELFGVETEQPQKEVEERPRVEESFGVEEEQQLKEAEERTRGEGLFEMEEEQQHKSAKEMVQDEELSGVVDEQQRKEAEAIIRDDELFGMDAEDITRIEDLFRPDEEDMEEMMGVGVEPEGGWDESAELTFLQAMQETIAESEEE